MSPEQIGRLKAVLVLHGIKDERKIGAIIADLDGEDDEPTFNELRTPPIKKAGMPAVKFTQTADDINEVCEEIRTLLIRKNESYGDSALSPRRICSKAPSDEQIKVRIDDKLNRMAQGNDDFNEDVTLDLLGYFILLRICQKRAAPKIVPRGGPVENKHYLVGEQTTETIVRREINKS